MIRSLHLLSLDADLQSREGSRALRETAGPWCEVVTRTIGRGGKYANLLWAVIGLRREVADLELVHAWDEQSLAVAVIAGARRIVFTAPPLLRPRIIRRLRGVMRFRDVWVVCTTPTQHRALVASGIPADRCALIRPAVDAPRVAGATRTDVRGQLGLTDDDFVLLAPGESTRATAHERAVWVGSILHVTDERYRVLLWGRGPRLDIAVGLGRKLRQRGLVVPAERVLARRMEAADLVAAADAVLVTANAPAPTLPVALAMAAGVPVVSVERPDLAELVIDNTTGLTVPDGSPRRLAQRVLDLRSDPARARQIAFNAKRRVEELFPPAAYLQAYRALYGLAASEAQPESAVILRSAMSPRATGAVRAPSAPST